MKKIVSLILLLALLSAFITGCDSEIYHWEFEQPHTNVEKLQIVEVKTYKDYDVVKELDVKLAETLFDEIESIDYNRYGWNLMSNTGTCFLIGFTNGEYDIISKTEPSHHRYDKDGQLVGYTSWLECKNNQFDELLEKYLQEAGNDSSIPNS